jgi:hypothetical protein
MRTDTHSVAATVLLGQAPKPASQPIAELLVDPVVKAQSPLVFGRMADCGSRSGYAESSGRVFRPGYARSLKGSDVVSVQQTAI